MAFHIISIYWPPNPSFPLSSKGIQTQDKTTESSNIRLDKGVKCIKQYNTDLYSFPVKYSCQFTHFRTGNGKGSRSFCKLLDPLLNARTVICGLSAAEDGRIVRRFRIQKRDNSSFPSMDKEEKGKDNFGQVSYPIGPGYLQHII